MAWTDESPPLLDGSSSGAPLKVLEKQLSCLVYSIEREIYPVLLPCPCRHVPYEIIFRVFESYPGCLFNEVLLGVIQIAVLDKFTGEKKKLPRLFQTGQFPTSRVLPLGPWS